MDEDLKKKSPFKFDIPLNPDQSKNDYNKISFKHFFPSLKGKAKLLDDYHDDLRSGAHNYVKSDKIKFHREDADDPDELVSCLCCRFMPSRYYLNRISKLFAAVKIMCHFVDCGSAQGAKWGR